MTDTVVKSFFEMTTVTRMAGNSIDAFADGHEAAELHNGERPVTITLQDRLDCGNLTVDEVFALKKRSRSGFYADRSAGLVSTEKQGRNTIVRGPVARRYIEGAALLKSDKPSEAA